MPGSSDLAHLLAKMEPTLVEGEFVFVTVPEPLVPAPEAVMIFREQEGTTYILARATADGLGLPYEGVWRQVTMRVHSDLAAVGFLAALSRALAEKGISVNAVSAYYHDHLFVPAGRANEAVGILQERAQAL